jgi:hypothetical protein
MANKQGPDFICVGAQKSGTTWLYAQLRQHPDICMPTHKELHYFDKHRITLKQYLAIFSNDRVSGDITPAYLITPTAPAEIKQVARKAKLFAILRNPAERAFSQYRMARYRGYDGPFADAFRQDARRMRSRGHYAEHLQNYLKLYRLGEDFQVFWYDDLQKNPEEFLRQIERYLQVADCIPSTIHDREVWPYHGDGLALSPSDREQLRQYYAEHNDRLAQLLGVKLAWNHREGDAIKRAA